MTNVKEEFRKFRDNQLVKMSGGCDYDSFCAGYETAMKRLTQPEGGAGFGDAVMKMNDVIGRGLRHVFFKDGLDADLSGLDAAEAYREGWRDAWLEAADELAHLNRRASDTTPQVMQEEFSKHPAIKWLRTKVQHHECEDCWYSCALICCADHRRSDKCDCGADEENEMRERIAQFLENLS